MTDGPLEMPPCGKLEEGKGKDDDDDLSMAKGADADDESLAEMHWLVKLFAPSDNDMERQAALYEMRHYSTMSFRETGGLM